MSVLSFAKALDLKTICHYVFCSPPTKMGPDASPFALPALRSLGELAGTQPVVIVDSREQDPLPFARLRTQTGALITGDYSVAGLETLFAVERKSIADLVACCVNQNRERFERELHRLRGFQFKRLLNIGVEEEIWRCKYHSNISPKRGRDGHPERVRDPL